MSPMFTIAQALRQRILRRRVCPVAVVGIATTPSAARLASSSRRSIMPVRPSLRSEWWLVRAGYTRRNGDRKVWTDGRRVSGLAAFWDFVTRERGPGRYVAHTA